MRFPPVVSRALVAPLLAAASLVGAACGGDAAAAAGLATVFDSSRTDSVIATTVGIVAAAAERRVVEVVRIAPALDDTSLFSEVFEFRVGRDGRFFVFDQGERRILIFGEDGALLRRVGRRGAGPGEFSGNNGMVVLPDGRLVQLDAQNARLSFFSPDGDYQSSWVVPAGFSTSNGVRSDRSGTLFLYRPVTAPRDGEILGRFGLVRLGEAGVWRDSLVPPDLPWERVVYVARKEGSTSATSPTHAPRFLWDWHPDGHFVSVSTARYALEVSRPARALRIVRDAPAIPVPADERQYEEERITANLRSLDPAWRMSGPGIPSVKPPVAGLAVARDGRIWVRVATPSEAIPEAERDVQRPNRPPPARFRSPVAYEVFDAGGRFLGRVRLPWGATWMHAEGDRVWYIVRDHDGLPAVVRARIEPGF